MEEILIQLGLTKNEITAYQWLLENGKHTAATIAHDLHLDKSSIYRAVENLTNLGLLFMYPKERGTIYEAKSPSILKEIYTKQKNQILNLESSLDTLIYNLTQNTGNKRDTYISIEKGYKAYISWMEKSLNENPDKLIREIWEVENPIFRLPKYQTYIKEYIQRRIKSNIHIKYIARVKQNSKHFFMDTNPKFLKEIRIMPDNFKSNNGLRIFGNYIEIISFDTNGDFIILVIKDKIVVELISDFFELLWQQSQPYSNIVK